MFTKIGLFTKNLRTISSIGPRVVPPGPSHICYPIPKGGTKEIPEDCPQLIIGKRDLINFPNPVRPVYPGRVRFGFIPEEWFQFFYEKTGATGPYAFLIGVVITLCSKEIYVMEHEFYAGVSLSILGYMAITKVGPLIAKYLDNEIDKYENAYKDTREHKINIYTQAMEDEKKQQYYALGQVFMMHAKLENIQLQLESIYRERLMYAYKEVKSRLDFQIEKRDVDRRINQKHMVQWVLEHVHVGITPEEESKNIDKCLHDLSLLAAVYHAVPEAEKPAEEAVAEAQHA